MISQHILLLTGLSIAGGVTTIGLSTINDLIDIAQHVGRRELVSNLKTLDTRLVVSPGSPAPSPAGKGASSSDFKFTVGEVVEFTDAVAEYSRRGLLTPVQRDQLLGAAKATGELLVAVRRADGGFDYVERNKAQSLGHTERLLAQVP